MNHYLVISELTDYEGSIKTHFSLTKGFEFSKGLVNNLKSSNISVFYLTTGASKSLDHGLKLINIAEITPEFITTIKVILLIRETNITEIIEKIPAVATFFLHNKNGRTIGIKSDSLAWLFDKNYSNYFLKKHKKRFIDLIVQTFDILCVQTDEFVKEGLSMIKKTHGNEIHNILQKKLFVSRMGIPNVIPLDTKIPNPYDVTHKYCVDGGNGLAPNRALHPLYFIDPYLPYSKKSTANYHKPKTILVYTGRIKTDNGNILFIMKEIMKILGDEYELHIFPGRFVIPNFDVSVLSPKNSKNLQLLRDIIFYDSDNVIIHHPYDDNDKMKFLQYADIAIDFSQTRPYNIRSPQGNAKLLEYCYYGVKVVCDRNINNSHLVADGQNGILLDGVPPAVEFAKAIREAKAKPINREYTIKKTIETNSWDLIAIEFLVANKLTAC